MKLRLAVSLSLGLLFAAAVVAVYWVGGGEFERGSDLAGAVALAFVALFFVPLFTFYVPDWNHEDNEGM